MTDPIVDPTVTTQHCRQLGYCARGQREWCASQGIDWPAFLREGLPASQVEAMGDALGIAAAKLAREEAQKGKE